MHSKLDELQPFNKHKKRWRQSISKAHDIDAVK